MKSLYLILLFTFCSVQSGFSQSNDFSINLNTIDKQKYLAVGIITSTVGYKIYHDHYKLIDPKTAHKKAFLASTLTTLGIGLLKETLDFTQTGFNWNSDDYGKDLFTAVMGGCAVTFTIQLFQ